MIVVTGPYLSVAKPSSGEVLYANNKTTITWRTGGGANVNEVKIEYSTDGGSTFKTIIDKTDNDGSHEWIIPDVNASENCYVKVSDINGNLQI